MNRKSFIYIFFLLLFLVSCTQKKQITYLQNIDKDGKENFFPKEKEDYTIQSQDVLYIKIQSINPEVDAMFSNLPATGAQSLFQNEANIYINGYVVDDSGYVDVPTIGKIELLGKTITEAKKAVYDKASQYIKKATVDVKLISYKFTVLGEVNRPGVYQNFNNKLTVLEAIGMAGDISSYGNRSKVLILRPTREGTQSFSIDLTDAAILQSDGFYLLPNDLVYVEPIKSKLFIINAPTYGLFLSSITTLILILNYINKQ